MREGLKIAMRFLRLGPVARCVRRVGYAGADAVGTILFAALRIVGAVAGDQAFDKERVRKILIVRTDRIGDVVLSTPAMRAVRQTFPEAEIHLLVSEYTKDLVIGNKSLDSVVTLGNVLEDDYDLAIALQPGCLPNKLAYASGARWRVGYTGQGGAFYLTHKIMDDRAVRPRHEVESALEVVAAVGCATSNVSLDISTTQKGESFANGFLASCSISSADLLVVIHPGSRQEYIRWTTSGFAAVADMLVAERRARVILIGGKTEGGLVDEVARKMSCTPCLLIGSDLMDLVSVIKRAHLFIGSSTGPMHVATALGIPTVAVFTSGHPLDSFVAWGPRGPHTRTVSCKSKDECRHPSDYDVAAAVASIGEDEVLSAALELLDSNDGDT